MLGVGGMVVAVEVTFCQRDRLFSTEKKVMPVPGLYLVVKYGHWENDALRAEI